MLKITATKYFYKGAQIYTLGLPDYHKYPLFSLERFLFIKDGWICLLTVDANCYDFYRSNKVKIYDLKDKEDLPQDVCTVIVYPFIDMNCKVGDTATIFDPGQLGPGFWVTLEQKYYSEEIGDTIYRFNGHAGSQRYHNVIYYVAQQKGIVGMANMEHGVIRDSLGFPFTNETNISLDLPQEDILGRFTNVYE